MNERFGRTNPVATRTGPSRWSRCPMSRATSGVPGTRGHDHEDVAAGHRGLGRLALAGSEVVEAEELAQLLTHGSRPYPGPRRPGRAGTESSHLGERQRLERPLPGRLLGAGQGVV